jgi:hypothetical protein
MSDNEYMIFPRDGDIPPKLFDSETEAPIRVCKVCGQDLFENNSDYLIQKSLRRYPDHDLEEVVFEFAICHRCNMKMHQEISEESRKIMEHYMQQHVGMNFARSNDLATENELDFNDWTRQCAATGKDASELDEYTIVAQGKGDKLQYGFLPMMLSFEVQDDLQEMLSEETKGFLDDFSKTHFSGPPGVEELIGPRRPFLV